jgi:tocopherol O-methyltransferase
VATESEDVAQYYASKTQSILRKYGPGPRIHFHTGICESVGVDGLSLDELRRRMVTGQQHSLELAIASWNGPQTLCGRVLDAGCGLGGASLTLAQQLGARVQALTNCAEHIPLIREFATQAGVSELVDARHGRAEDATGEFDAIVSIEATCYFDRRAWFEALAGCLRPGGHVFVMDCLLDPAVGAPGWDAYWHTELGSLEEYTTGAEAAGFRLVAQEQINDRMMAFWPLSMQWTRLTHANLAPKSPESKRLEASLEQHAQVLRAFETGGIRYLRLTWQRQ